MANWGTPKQGSAGEQVPFCRKAEHAGPCFALFEGKFTEGSKPMWKKVFLALAVAGLLAGAAVPIQTTPADAARSGCHKAAKARYPGDHTARRAFKRWCKSQWKLYEAAHRGGPKAPA